MCFMLFSDVDCVIVIVIIDLIDELGYLIVIVEDILQSVNIEDMEELVEVDEIECVFKWIQMFDLIGLGLCILQECLLVQLK